MVLQHLRRFYEKQRTVTPTAAFLQMHLLIERQMKELLSKCAPNPEPLKDLSAKLEGRARIAYAFKLIEADLFNQLLFLDNVRNNLAHQLEFKITSETKERLRDLIHVSPEALEGLARENESWEEEFYILLSTIHLEIWGIVEPTITTDEFLRLIVGEVGQGQPDT